MSSQIIPSIDLPAALDAASLALNRLESAMNRLDQSLRKRDMAIAPEMTEALLNLHETFGVVRQQGEQALNQSARMQALIQASAGITNSLELDEVLSAVMESVIALSKAERAYLMLREGASDDPDALVIRATHQWDGTQTEETDVEFSRGVVREAFTKAQPILTMNAQSDDRFSGRQSIIGLALRSVLCVPLLIDKRVVGVLYADNRMRSGLFTQETVALLSAFGTQAAIVIEKARLHGEELRRISLEKDLSVAKQIQLSLLPKSVPSVAGWEFSAYYEPARVVGGDFYDFFGFTFDGQSYQGIVIADVADKGVGAALFMSLARTMIRTAALSIGSPCDALTQANALIVQDSSRSNLFLSAFYAVLNPVTGAIIYSNAGHNPPVLYRAATQNFEYLTGKGIVLGLFEEITLQDLSAQMNPGDLLVFYTDGIPEAMSQQNEEFGEQRLCEAIWAHRHGSAQQVKESIIEAVMLFTKNAVQSDDLTLVVVRRGA
jgi:sigma-B regulation protein RsbU (phosphoserine phosphatase)